MYTYEDRPINDVIKRKRLAGQYAKGEISREEYEAFVTYYKLRMSRLAKKAFEGFGEEIRKIREKEAAE